MSAILATLCYVKHDGKTLMLHRIKRKQDVHEGKWNGLGGKMKRGETPEACVIREVREESGLTIEAPELRGIITFPDFSHRSDWYVFVYVSHQFKGTLCESEEGCLEWVPDDKLLMLPLWEGDPIFLKWLDDNRFFSAKFNYRNGKFLDHSVVFYS